MTDLTGIVTLTDLRSKSTQLKQIQDALATAHGNPVYFPFAWYSGQLRAQQAYLTKFPAAVVELFPQLQVLGGTPTATAANPPKDVEPRNRTSGYISDPKVRKAIETQAMKQADELLQQLGYQTKDVSANNPYDIHATRDDEELAVEVKGSSGTATTVELTIGEVKKAREPGVQSMLVVVDQIPITESPVGIETGVGRIRFWPDWDPDPSGDRLQPIRFRYLLEPTP